MMPLKNLPMDEISQKYISGKSCLQLSQEYGVNRQTIHNRLLKYGLVLRPQSRVFCLEEAIGLYNKGKTCEQVAKMLGVTEWAINKSLKNSGVDMRDTYHPIRREQSRKLMAERMENLGCIRIGKHEPKFCQLLWETYGDMSPQYKIEKGGHHFDVFSGGFLWELDEKEHKTHQYRIEKDMKYDTRAKELGYSVRHVWEWDFFETGIEKWHLLV